MPEDDPSILADPDRRTFRSRLAQLVGRRPEPAPASAHNGAADAPAPTPSEMRLRVAEFQNARVRDVMIPRVEISAIEADSGIDDVLKTFAEETHSRLPVFRGSLDDPIGFVHIKDVVSELSRHPNGEAPADDKPLGRLRREILFVPASMRLPDLLVKMQSTRIHLALVVDEYGGTDGLVTLEDLVEQIVGDIEDEHDEDEALILARGRGLWEVDARADIEDFEAEAELSLALPDYEDEIDTLGGLVFALAGRVPERGEIVTHPQGVDFEVVDADPRRIKRLRARFGPARADSSVRADETASGVKPVAGGGG